MKPEKIRRILQEERPDMVEIPVKPPKSANMAADVDERAASEATWAAKRDRVTPKPDLTEGVSTEAINEMFAPRELGAGLGGADAAGADAPAATTRADRDDDSPGIVRAAKRHPKGARYAGDAADTGEPTESGAGVKDFIVDDKRGIIGSQG